MPVRHARTSGRPRGVVLIASGLLCGIVAIVGMPATSAQEAQAPPATLFSYDLTSGANGYAMFYEDPSGSRQGEGNVPEASASLTTGPIGLGLASMAWPGSVAANGGTLVLVLAPDAPEEASELNYPVRAEARTGQEPATTKNEIPGASMVATATPALVEAEGKVQDTTGESGGFGPSRAYSKVTLDGAKGTSQSASRVEKISLAGGVIKIDSVTSTAEAVTDGVKASGDASTVVSGMTIGGQPATVGEDGVTIGEEGQPANAVANQIARQALAQSGAEIVLGAPTKELDGPTGVVSAPSLVISWESEGGTFAVILGGARAAATGAPPLDDALLGGDTPVSDVDPVPAAGDAGDGGGTGSGSTGDTGGAVEPTDPGAPADDGAAAAPPDDGGGEVALDAAPARSLSKPVRPVFFLLGLLAALLVAMGMRRMGDDVLAERAASASCPLDGAT